MQRLFQYLQPLRLPIGAVLILVTIRVLSDLYLPTLTADIVNNGIVAGNTGYILQVGIHMLAIAALGGAASIAASYQSARVAASFAQVLREEVFTRVGSFSLTEFDKFGTTSLINRTTNDITQLQMVLLFGLRLIVTAPLMSIGGIFMALSLDSALSLVFIAILPLLIIIITFIARRGIPLFQRVQERLDILNLVLREGLTGIRVVRAFNRDLYERKRFQGANLDYTTTAIQVQRTMAIMRPVMMLIMNLTTISIIWFGGLRIDSGFMLVGDLMAFIQYGMHIMFSLAMLSMMFVQIPRATASAHRVAEVLNTVAQVQDPALAIPAGNGKGNLEFKDVTFSYPGAERPALSHISFQAIPGQVTAIIGGTGSGKSTLSSLLLRLYDIDKGSIEIDGIDIRELALEDLRGRIGFVPQKAVLFTGSIEDNILFGNQNAGAKDVIRAAEVAQAANFIEKMPLGYASLITQEGRNISGGQKQRLAIARALARKPDIYILDEFFSALDFQTGARLRRALKEETGHSTVIIIAQRVSTIMDAEQIIVLEEGKIVGLGTHRELLVTCRVYKEIASSQLTEEEIA